MILLDAGHGGYVEGVTQTPGRGIYGERSSFSEGQYNRMIVNMIAFNLSTLNIPFHIIAPENYDTPLFARVDWVNEIASKYGPVNCFLLSVHQNGFENPSVKGFELFTSFGETQSDRYAEYMAERFETRFPDRQKRWYVIGSKRAKEANFKILRSTKCPAVLTEWGFMTNPQEKKYLLSRQGIQDQSEFLSCICQDIQNKITKNKL